MWLTAVHTSKTTRHRKLTYTTTLHVRDKMDVVQPARFGLQGHRQASASCLTTHRIGGWWRILRRAPNSNKVPASCLGTGTVRLAAVSALWKDALLQELRFRRLGNDRFVKCGTTGITPWYRVLPEKLTGPHPVKKFPPFYGTRSFITAFTSSRHLSLSWARSIQSMIPIPLPEDPS